MKINEFTNPMLDDLVNLKTYVKDGKKYLKVSDFLKIIDKNDPDNEGIIEDFNKLPFNCFTKDRRYVLKECILDILIG